VPKLLRRKKAKDATSACRHRLCPWGSMKNGLKVDTGFNICYKTNAPFKARKIRYGNEKEIIAVR